MAVPQGHISKRSVDALTCPHGKDREFLWDDNLAGFGVAAFKSGAKVYLCQYRQNGKSRRFTLGQHGRLTPDQARNEAKKHLGAVAQGNDPINERQKARAVPLFSDIADQYMRTHIQAKRKPRTLDAYETLLRLHILPAIGGLRITEIRRAHSSKMHASLTAQPGAANRALTVVSAIWNWAAGERGDLELPANPVKGVKRNPEHSCERFLSGAELSLGLPIIGRLLGHASPSTTSKYAHLADDPMRRAVETIGATITAAMSRSTGAEVVPINKRPMGL